MPIHPDQPTPRPPRPARRDPRAVPEFGMSRAGREHLRRQGVVVIPFRHSVTMDPQRLQPHVHPFFQVFLLRGAAHVMHDFVEFRARGTTLVFMSPGQVHTARPAPGMTGTTLSFTQAFFDGDSAPPSTLLDFPFFYPAEVKPWLSLRAPAAAAVAGWFSAMQQEFDAGLPDSGDVLRAQLRLLLLRVHRLYQAAHPRREASRAAALVRHFRLAVEQHFHEWTQVPAYARQLGVTPNHLHDVVRAESGRSAGDLIRERRLLDAKRLLSHSELDVAEIGYQLGFEDPSYFTRFFRRLEGTTPVAFREQIREKYQRKAD